jgi:membrane-bound serine protease (ClpP class)
MRHIPLAAMLLAGLSLFPCVACAQDESAPKVAPKPIGQFLTVTSPLNDQMVSELTNLAIELQAQAVRENRDALLVLEIEPGTSGFGHVSDAVRFLTSSDVSRVRTIAWLPRSVDGTRAVLALACHDIVMHPDATLGDIGRGEAVSNEDQIFIMSLVDRRRNPRLSRGVAQAMMNPSEALLRVSVETSPNSVEQRFLTPAELMLLQNQNAVISKTETIKEAGAPGNFLALDAEKAGFLLLRTAKNRSEVAAAFELPLESMREPARNNADVVPRVIAVEV